MGDYAIGVDLGGTNIRSAAVDRNGKILFRDKRVTEVSKGKENVISNILKSVNAVKTGYSGGRLKGVGIGTPGFILFKEGIITQSPNFPDWINFNLKERLQREFDTPFYIENDANAATIGEGWCGAGRGVGTFCVLTLGTGIGGGIILNKKIWRGADGMGGELGHIIVEKAGGHLCGCGGTGCLEQYASASAIKREAERLFSSKDGTPLREICGNDISKISAQILHELATNGDRLSLDIFNRVGTYLGIAIVSLIHIFNMEMVIICGGVSLAWNTFKDRITAVIEERYKVPSPRKVIITKGECGDDAGVLGAARLALTPKSYI